LTVKYSKSRGKKTSRMHLAMKLPWKCSNDQHKIYNNSNKDKRKRIECNAHLYFGSRCTFIYAMHICKLASASINISQWLRTFLLDTPCIMERSVQEENKPLNVQCIVRKNNSKNIYNTPSVLKCRLVFFLRQTSLTLTKYIQKTINTYKYKRNTLSRHIFMVDLT